MDVRTSRLVHNTVHYYHSFFDRLTVLCCHKVCGCLPINSGSCTSCEPPVFSFGGTVALDENGTANKIHFRILKSHVSLFPNPFRAPRLFVSNRCRFASNSRDQTRAKSPKKPLFQGNNHPPESSWSTVRLG
jgi:hypothetical protein